MYGRQLAMVIISSRSRNYFRAKNTSGIYLIDNNSVREMPQQNIIIIINNNNNNNSDNLLTSRRTDGGKKGMSYFWGLINLGTIWMLRRGITLAIGCDYTMICQPRIAGGDPTSAGYRAETTASSTSVTSGKIPDSEMSGIKIDYRTQFCREEFWSQNLGPDFFDPRNFRPQN